MHTRIDFDLITKAGIEKYRSFLHKAADLVIGYGGSLSGEHGDGQSRGQLLPKMFGPELMQVFLKFKSIWDPDWKMIPGKVIDAYRADENLRLGIDYHRASLRPIFSSRRRQREFFAGDSALRRGRRVPPRDRWTMCPSYRVTREKCIRLAGAPICCLRC